jgi:hypothetical protein
MKKIYGMGNYILGLWIGFSTYEEYENKTLRIAIFPFDFYIILDDVSLCFRVHIFEFIKLSLIIEID